MSFRHFSWIFIFLITMTVNLGALLPNLRLCNPYLLPSGKFQTAFSSGFSDFQQVLFLYEVLDFSYGVNDDAAFSVSLPFLIFPQVEENGMILGDGFLDFRGVLFRSTDLTVQFMGNFGVRMGTGVIQQDGLRSFGTKTVSFYPVSTGQSGFFTGVSARLLIARWLLAVTTEYNSVNLNGEDLFNLNLDGDRISVKSLADYYFKFGNQTEKTIILRPACYMNAYFNLSDKTEVSDNLTLTAEINLKFKHLFKFSADFSRPIWSKDTFVPYDFRISIQKVF